MPPADVMPPADAHDTADERQRWQEFVRGATRLQRPPRVPELLLHLADEMTPVWELTEAELGEQGIDPPYWAFAWAGGQALARHLLDTPALVAGRRVLDLAAGSGLCALASLRAGAATALAVDIDPVSGVAAVLNAEANGLAARLSVRTGDVLDSGPPDVDLVLAGDVCYDRDMTARILPWLQAAATAGREVLLGDPGRAYLPSAGLSRVAEYDVPTTADLEGREICPAAVYALSGA